MQVAEGKAHLYPRLAPTSEWDTAASHIIVLEAGGIVLQAGKCDNKGAALENWKVGEGGSTDVRNYKVYVVRYTLGGIRSKMQGMRCMLSGTSCAIHNLSFTLRCTLYEVHPVKNTLCC